MHTLDLTAAPIVFAPRPAAPVSGLARPPEPDELAPALPPDTRDRSDREEPLDALVISDIHLGSDNCEAKPLADFLQQILDGDIRTRRLIIAGDVFDSIDFRRLKKSHWKVLSQIRHLSDKLEIIWIAGNHDGSADIVSHLLGVSVTEQFIFASGGRKILIIHGHIFDDFIEDHPILTWFADCIYFALQKVDRTHFIARLAKSRSKTFVRCIAKIRAGAIALARQHDCQVAICGHTHHAAADDAAGDVHYYNSGCWTENPAHYLTVRHGRVILHGHHCSVAPAQRISV